MIRNKRVCMGWSFVMEININITNVQYRRVIANLVHLT